MSPQDLETRLTQLKREVPTRGFERHPLVVKTIAELPSELQSLTVTALADQEALQTIIAFPPQIHHGWTYVPKQALLFTPTDAIHLLASIWPEEEPHITRVNASDVLYLKVSLLLLYGFLEIVAQGPTAPTRLGMEFNTVGWHHISSPVRHLLRTSQVTPGTPEGKTAYAPAVQQAFEELPLKFSNGVKLYGLLPGETLEALVFQPGTWERWGLFFRRPVTPDILLMLTTNYLVVIQEELKVKQGWTFTYIPRQNIAGMQSRPGELWTELAIQLQREDQSVDYTLLLKNEAVETWRELWVCQGGQWQESPNNPDQ
jgi:hypothetical protein